MFFDPLETGMKPAPFRHTVYNALVVPRRAVQRVDEQSVVFVRTGQGVYEPRIVSLGRSDPDVVEIHGAVRRGDRIVTDGAFLLKTELVPGSIGAGCCEVEAPGGGEG